MLPPPRAGWLQHIGVVVAVLGLTIVGVDYLSVPPAATGRIAITTSEASVMAATTSAPPYSPPPLHVPTVIPNLLVGFQCGH